jgi:hypothetical protein
VLDDKRRQARGAQQRIGGMQTRRQGLVEVFANHRRLEDRQRVIDQQHRCLAQRRVSTVFRHLSEQLAL